MPETGMCHFHGRAEKLCKAHIYPRFLYSLKERDVEGLPIAYGRDGSERKVPSGTYDPYILCHEADNFIGEWLDSFAAKALNQVPMPSSEQAKCNDAVYINESVAQFKVFLLSILWRAHISSRTEFLDTNIGDKLAGEILQILKTKATPSDDRYTYVLRRYDLLPKHGIFAPPVRVRIEGRTAYELVFGGFSCLLWTDTRKPPHFFEAFSNVKGDRIKVVYEAFWGSRLAETGLEMARDHVRAREHTE